MISIRKSILLRNGQEQYYLSMLSDGLLNALSASKLGGRSGKDTEILRSIVSLTKCDRPRCYQRTESRANHLDQDCFVSSYSLSTHSHKTRINNKQFKQKVKGRYLTYHKPTINRKDTTFNYTNNLVNHEIHSTSCNYYTTYT